MTQAVERLVRSRANGRCEYCRMPEAVLGEKHVFDHIRAKYHDGPTISENLALCCIRCNLYKGTNLAGFDAESGSVRRIFHPRRDSWEIHFIYDGPILIGLTSIGRATVSAMKMNEPQRVFLRQTLMEFGLF